jgi:hypothetical protein
MAKGSFDGTLHVIMRQHGFTKVSEGGNPRAYEFVNPIAHARAREALKELSKHGTLKFRKGMGIEKITKENLSRRKAIMVHFTPNRGGEPFRLSLSMTEQLVAHGKGPKRVMPLSALRVTTTRRKLPQQRR